MGFSNIKTTNVYISENILAIYKTYHILLFTSNKLSMFEKGEVADY